MKEKVHLVAILKRILCATEAHQEISLISTLKMNWILVKPQTLLLNLTPFLFTENNTFMWVFLILQVSPTVQEGFITSNKLRIIQNVQFSLKLNSLMDPFLHKTLSLFSKIHLFIVEVSVKALSMEKDT